MQIFSVSHSRDGWSLALSEVKAWAYVLERLADGPLCLCRFTNKVEWVWKVPVGSAKRDEDGWLENSIGGVAYSIENGMSAFAYRHGTKNLGFVKISAEEARQLSPKFVAMVDDWDNDDETASTGS